MPRCNFCGNQKVVLIAGNRYCPEHLHFFDEPVILHWILELKLNLKIKTIIENMHKMFEVEEGVKFSDIAKLHDKFPYKREWDNERGCYIYPQKDYVQKCFLDFIISQGVLTSSKAINEAKKRIETEII